MKQNTIVLAILLLLGTLSQCALAGQNLVQNGDFETGDLTFWNVSDPNTVFTDVNSHSGNYAAWMGTYPGTGSMSQDLATIIGQQYQVSFFVANDYLQDPFLSSPSSLVVSFGGTVLYTQNPVPYADYTAETALVTATQSTTTLTFTEQQQRGYLLLDDISVTAIEVVPEFNGMMSVGVMLGVCSLVLRRHRKLFSKIV